MPHPPSIVTPPIMCSSGAAGLAPPILSSFSCSSILVGVGWLITTSQTQQVELPLKPTMSPRCAAALGNQLGSRAQSQCDWVDWRSEKRLLINSRAHICSCQHIICQELGAPFASTSFFIQFRHNTGKTTEIVISTVGFCVQFFVFGFLWSVAAAAVAAAAAATPVASRHNNSWQLQHQHQQHQQSPIANAISWAHVWPAFPSCSDYT